MKTFREYRQENLIEARQSLQLPKGLSWDEARRQAAPKIKGDHRGFSYNPITGLAVYI